MSDKELKPELAPCPFCGADAEIGKGGHTVQCSKICATTGWCEETKEAIGVWNTRPSPKADWISVEKFYDKLEASQVELTSEQAEILYSNLFDMYDS